MEFLDLIEINLSYYLNTPQNATFINIHNDTYNISSPSSTTTTKRFFALKILTCGSFGIALILNIAIVIYLFGISFRDNFKRVTFLVINLSYIATLLSIVAAIYSLGLDSYFKGSIYCPALPFTKCLLENAISLGFLGLNYERLRMIRVIRQKAEMSVIIAFIWTASFVGAFPLLFQNIYNEEIDECVKEYFLGSQEITFATDIARFFLFHLSASAFLGFELHKSIPTLNGYVQLWLIEETWNLYKIMQNLRSIYFGIFAFLVVWFPSTICNLYLQILDYKKHPAHFFILELLNCSYLIIIPIFAIWTNDSRCSQAIMLISDEIDEVQPKIILQKSDGSKCLLEIPDPTSSVNPVDRNKVIFEEQRIIKAKAQTHESHDHEMEIFKERESETFV